MIKALTSFAAILCFLLNTIAHGQTFNKAFLHNDRHNNYKEAYSFLPNGQFTWFKFFQDRKEYGSGKYTVNNNSIQLRFQPAGRELDLQAEQTFPLNSQSARIDIHALNSSGDPFEGLTAIVGPDTIVTDRNGSATLNISNPPVSGEIHFEVNGYRTINMPLNLRGKQNVYGFVIDNTIHYKENETLNFDLVQTRRQLILTDKSGSVAFDKISRRRFLHLQQHDQ